MYRTIAALALASALAACDGTSLSDGGSSGIGIGAQPLVAEPATGTGTTTTTTDADPDNLYASELSNASADLTVDKMTFDPTTGELVFNNLPFDSNKAVTGENSYTANAGVTTALAGVGSGFTAYRNAGGTSANSQYFAVFRRSASGNSQVGTVGSDRYLSFGFGGAAAQRLNGAGALPNATDAYVFTGE